MGGVSQFTQEELAELAAFDALIDEEPEWDPEEVKAARRRDAQAKLDRMDNRKRKIAEAQREYRAANREKIAEAQREYYAANREKIAEAQREYRAANRDRERTALRDWRKAHGLSQAKLAKLLNVSQGTISNWEQGIGCPWTKGEMKHAV